MRLSQWVQLRVAEIPLQERINRLKNIKHNPEPDDVKDLLVQIIAMEPEHKDKAEALLKQYLANEVTLDHVVDEVETWFKKWKQIAKKNLPGVRKKLEADLKRTFKTGSAQHDPFLKANAKTFISMTMEKVDPFIISLAETVFVYENPESALHIVLNGDEYSVLATVSFRRDRSLYQNYRYYVPSEVQKHIHPKQHTVHINQPFSRKTVTLDVFGF